MKRSIYTRFSLILLALIMMSINLYSQYERKVVFEEFTEVWCGPCASLSPMLAVWLENHPDIIPIMYTSYFKVNGSTQYVSQADYNARNSLYSVPFYPYGRLNGDALPPNSSYPGFPTDTSAMNGVIDTMTTETPVKIEIDFENNGSTGSVEVKITSDVDVENKRLFVIITEHHHTFEKQSNGMTDYHDIFRETLTASYGDVVNLTANEMKTFNFDYELPEDINYELNAIALLQSPTTKYIIQSEKVFSYPTSVNAEDKVELNIFPNPVVDELSVNINSINENINEFIIYDLLGNEIMKQSVSGKANKITISTEGLNTGIYFINILTNKNRYVENIIVQ